ncbi:putative transposase, Tnp1/En/Spm-like protein [Tanacetum coccineum]|uniref:Transposase, Tnp1/En/Spm-like protein n=1 Tax=Tanacetum coccineum TaxID=301880 RepID=A0ABQ5EVM0_9ASTR
MHGLSGLSTQAEQEIDTKEAQDQAMNGTVFALSMKAYLEQIGALEPRKSALEDDFEEEEEKDEDDQHIDTDVGGHEKDRYREQSPTRERGRDRKRDSHENRCFERRGLFVASLEKVAKQSDIDAIGEPITNGPLLRAIRNAEINYIALGTVYKTDGKQMLHNKELPKDFYKVSVNKSLVDAACIPDIGNNGFKTVKDAVGGFFAWPKDQVVLDPKATPPSTIQMIGENKTAPKLQSKRKNVYVSRDAMQKQARMKSQKSLNY